DQQGRPSARARAWPGPAVGDARRQRRRTGRAGGRAAGPGVTLALVGRAAAVARADAPILPLRLDEVCYEVGGVRLIDRITLEFGRDGKAVILGPNGAGKSLLLRLCHGLIRPSSGAVAWASADRAAVQRAQAMVFQRPVLLRRSVAANVDYALATRGTPRAVRARLV